MSSLIAAVRRRLVSLTDDTAQTRQPVEAFYSPPAPSMASHDGSTHGPDSVMDAPAAASTPQTSPPPSPARVFPSSGFRLVNSAVKFEEERLRWYSLVRFYPAHIGDVLNDRYQIVAKLGFGSGATTWLCRDLVKHRYVTVKIFALGSGQTRQELDAATHIEEVVASRRWHSGADRVRRLLEMFTVGPTGNMCLVYKPLGVSLYELRTTIFGGKIPLVLVKGYVYFILRGLDFLHRKAHLVHADIHERNVMLSLTDEERLRWVEDREMSDPSPRKVYKNHIIFASRFLEGEAAGVPVICDFGKAHYGQKTYEREDVMPNSFRAPETVMHLDWDEKLDIWGLGLMVWSMVEGTRLFPDSSGEDRRQSELTHMGRMVSLMGHPPWDMLQQMRRSALTRFYITPGMQLRRACNQRPASFEEEARALTGNDRTQSLRFIRSMLRWQAEDRPSARDLADDPWVLPPQ